VKFFIQTYHCLIAQLLTKLKIRAQQNSETLLKVIKNPITNYLPSNCLKIGLIYKKFVALFLIKKIIKKELHQKPDLLK